MTDLWLTSDTHFLHRRMVGPGGFRPQFDTIEEHDEHHIEQWNKVVKTWDIVWHEGDVGVGSATAILNIVAHRLNGVKHLITGNHDQVWPGNRHGHTHQGGWRSAFASIQQYSRRRIAGTDVLMSHFPYRGDHTQPDRYVEYRLQDTGMWLLHGHTHGMWRVNGRQIDVGVDVWDRPVNLDEIAQIIKAG